MVALPNGAFVLIRGVPQLRAIYATETGTDRRIIIENQLEDTNHDHLGKLITYASGKDADIVIWIVKRAREEHRAAVEWLNNHTDENISFFLLEIKLYRIGNSDPAVKFEVIEKPNDWTKEIKKQSTADPAKQFRLSPPVSAYEALLFSKFHGYPSCFLLFCLMLSDKLS